MAPMTMLSICIAATLFNAFRWLFSPLNVMAAAGLKGYSLPSIVIVLPILASVTNSLATVRIVSTGTELNLEAIFRSIFLDMLPEQLERRDSFFTIDIIFALDGEFFYCFIVPGFGLSWL